MKHLSFFKKLLWSLIIVMSVVACSTRKDENTTARLQIRLTDAPANYDAVHVDIQSIEIHSNATASASDKGWVKINVLNPGRYNLLDFTNGMDTLLTDDVLPAGKISQIRLILGSNNSVVVDGVSYPLATPSAMQSGLKLQVNTNLQEGIMYQILLDFDAALSIVATGNGSYALKPIIRTIVKAETGAIKGIVSPKESSPVIYAISAQQDTVSAYPNLEGKFLIQGLKSGNYKVVIVPEEGYQQTIVNDVSVNLGVVTDVGTVTISVSIVIGGATSMSQQ